MKKELLPYESGEPNAYRWTEIAYDRLVAGELKALIHQEPPEAGAMRQVRVDGPCPRCDDDVRYSQDLDAVVGEDGNLGVRTLGERAATKADFYLPLVVSCRCTAAHPGRPDDVTEGCGVNFRIEVLAG